MIYIPTLTTKLRYDDSGDYDYVLYSPNKNLTKIIKGKEITIWDNYTFYLLKRLHGPNKIEIARNHYLWLIDFIKNNWQEGITVITPDIDWLPDNKEIMDSWRQHCGKFPQLYVPGTWDNTDGLNIVGYALRRNSNKFHDNWNHCLAHTRDNLASPIQTYDRCQEINLN